jgi:hypothetical protein
VPFIDALMSINITEMKFLTGKENGSLSNRELFNCGKLKDKDLRELDFNRDKT